MQIRKPQVHELPTKKSLSIAAIAAAVVLSAVLITIILPAERGIDLTGIGERLHLTRMGLIKSAMAEADAPREGRPVNRDELKISLPAGQGQEIKMEMKKGFIATYSWQTDGEPVYHDTHGDTYLDESVFVSYSKGESVQRDKGTITAIFGGHHGWYWVNNSDNAVTITLQTDGQYLNIHAK